MNTLIVIGFVLYSIAFLIPAAKLLQRAGYSPYYCVLALIPGVKIIALWMFAFGRWPNRQRVF